MLKQPLLNKEQLICVSDFLLNQVFESILFLRQVSQII